MQNSVRTIRVLACALACGGMFATSAFGDIVVNDTWRDGTRSDPVVPVYSENGVDVDADGDIESAWFRSGAGTLDPVGNGGPLRGSMPTGGTSSATWMTHFTPEASPVSLAPGDRMKVTWNFTLSNVNAGNTSQNFRVALFDSPNGSRATVDPFTGANDAYTGYSMFMNMGPTLGNSSPFQLRERNIASGDLLGTSGNWANLVNGASSGNAGYAAGTPYSMEWNLLRNLAGELEISVRMTGGNLNNAGFALASFVDTTPQPFTFDSFAIRPSGATTTAETFDTSLFKVEYIAVPEPASLSALAMVGAMALRRRR